MRATIASALLAVTLAAASAHGQDYPSKPIRILVPAQAGGIGDILPRILGQKLGDAGTATIVVENRTAGAGVVAAEAVARAQPDGYLLLMGNQGQLAIRPHLARLPYDPIKDFAPVILMVTVPNLLIVHPSVPANTLGELIAYAKANPGKLSYASQGIGASGHIAGELFKQAAGVDITHVPYRGAAPAAQDLAAGHVSMMFDVVSLALGPIRAGAVRALGVAANERVAVLPEVPTLAENGYPLEVGAWFGLLAPAGTPPAIIGWLNRESAAALAAPDARDRFVAQGATMPLGTSEAFRDFIAAQTARFGEVIRRAGIKEQ
jgi:tripartite-type tricarboxylate transporter receptor subunit TctC